MNAADMRRSGAVAADGSGGRDGALSAGRAYRPCFTRARPVKEQPGEILGFSRSRAVSEVRHGRYPPRGPAQGTVTVVR